MITISSPLSLSSIVIIYYFEKLKAISLDRNDHGMPTDMNQIKIRPMPFPQNL